MKVISKEGHCFNSRAEVMAELLVHSGNRDSETQELIYDRLELNMWTNEQLLGYLSDCFSIYMEDLEC